MVCAVAVHVTTARTGEYPFNLFNWNDFLRSLLLYCVDCACHCLPLFVKIKSPRFASTTQCVLLEQTDVVQTDTKTYDCCCCCPSLHSPHPVAIVPGVLHVHRSTSGNLFTFIWQYLLRLQCLTMLFFSCNRPLLMCFFSLHAQPPLYRFLSCFKWLISRVNMILLVSKQNHNFSLSKLSLPCSGNLCVCYIGRNRERANFLCITTDVALAVPLFEPFFIQQ